MKHAVTLSNNLDDVPSLFLVEGVDHQFTAFGRCLPVDGADRIANLVFTYMVEDEAGAMLATFAFTAEQGHIADALNLSVADREE